MAANEVLQTIRSKAYNHRLSWVISGITCEAAFEMDASAILSLSWQYVITKDQCMRLFAERIIRAFWLENI